MKVLVIIIYYSQRYIYFAPLHFISVLRAMGRVIKVQSKVGLTNKLALYKVDLNEMCI